MSDKVVRTSEINFKVKLNENNVPVAIDWSASDTNDNSTCKSLMIALWDEKEKNTLKIDLWTKDMLVDEMKQFFHQNLVTMADTFERATGDEKLAADMRDFCEHFRGKAGIVLQEEK